MRKKIQNIAVLVEFLAGSGLAIFFHIVLNHAQAAYIIFGTGILLSLGTYLLRDDIDKTRETLLDQYHKAHETTFLIAQIADPECQAKAHEVMSSAKRTLALLQHGRIPLDESEFYLEAAKCCEQAVRHIKAVDPVNNGWTTRGALLNLYQANMRALERGVKITRIFVVDDEDLATQETQKILTAQFRDGIDVRIAYRNELPQPTDISGRDNAASYDLTIYDDRTVTDLAAQAGKYFGTKTRETSHVDKYLHLFDLVDHVAHAAAEQDGKIVPATGVTHA
jgi:hypothetical protein